MKTCPRCLVPKPLSDFAEAAPGKGDSNGKQAYCFPCRIDYGADWRDKNRVHLQHQNRKRRYGLSEDQFTLLMMNCGGACYICREKFVRTPSVDHDHKTGQVRGLLCQRCNVAVGFIEDGLLTERVQMYLARVFHG